MVFHPIHTHSPAAPVAERFADIGIVHSAVAGRAENDEVLRTEAPSRWCGGQMKQVMDLAVALPVPHQEAGRLAELTGRTTAPLHIAGDVTRPLVGLDVALDQPEGLRR